MLVYFVSASSHKFIFLLVLYFYEKKGFQKMSNCHVLIDLGCAFPRITWERKKGIKNEKNFGFNDGFIFTFTSGNN